MTAPLPTPRLHGASNFRDLGGYRNQEGRTVRSGRVFRSDHLAELTASDVATLRQLGVRRALDFRGVAERAAQGYDWPELDSVSLPVEPTVVQAIQDLLLAGQEVTPSHVVVLMCQTYRDFVRHNAEGFAAFFAHLLEHPGPLVFHCTAGKDRTGFAAALLLSALEVDSATILHDYLLTNARYRRPMHPNSGVSDEALAILWRVQPEFLQAAFTEITEQSGGMHAYLKDRLGVGTAERARLAEWYLVD
ncbi:MAG: tyrosine-protein phosphatase [Rhodoferax sp.]|nr:tyrosine-protein phosphatase [Rhodoferax sp.]MCF8210522.1 tyrosine-protein phosphatase [Rhodoferax sp.]